MGIIGYRGKKSLAYLIGDIKIETDKNRHIGQLSIFEKKFNKYLKRNTRKNKKRTK